MIQSRHFQTKPNVNLTFGIRDRRKQATLGVFHILFECLCCGRPYVGFKQQCAGERIQWPICYGVSPLPPDPCSYSRLRPCRCLQIAVAGGFRISRRVSVRVGVTGRFLGVAMEG